MSPVEEILQQIARLSPEDRAKVQESLQTRTMTLFTVSGDQLRQIYDDFAPVRDETKDSSEEEIDEFLSEVIAEVRSENRVQNSD